VPVVNDTAEHASGPPADRLRRAIEHAAHLLPAQGPIGVFIHHNTLHAFEHLPFDEAVQQAGAVFGCEPYLSEARYHRERAGGRITDDDLRSVLTDDLGDTAHAKVGGVTRWDLRFAVLTHPLWEGTADEVAWKVAAEEIPTRHAELWGQCLAAVAAEGAKAFTRPAVTVNDTELSANELLARYTAAFLDQGVSHRPQPNKAAGFFRGFCELYAGGWHVERWRRALAKACRQALRANVAPLDSALASLAALGVSEAEWDHFLGSTLLPLRGWGGMVRQVEQRADSVHHPIPAGSFAEFVAVRLLLDTAASRVADSLRESVPMPLSERVGHPTVRAFTLFQAARAAGLSSVSPALLREVEAFPGVERRRLFHRAYERRLRVRTLDALAYRVRHPAATPAAPRFQAITCLDEREESFRRHLEEVAPDCQTFGAAGFFAVPMYYRGAADAHFVPLCPIVMRPAHWVTEQVDDHAAEAHEQQAKRRSRLGKLWHGFHLGSRTPVVGTLLSAAVGALASVPLVARVLFPRLTAKIRGTAGKVVRTPPHTTLALERVQPTAGDHNGHLGFSVPEMVTQGERLLRDIGLIAGFSPLVFVLGHGSGSLNNPHMSAYDCGACGGSPGAPNGRAAAHLLNDPRVRDGLRVKGIVIPQSTWFVGGYHNTCDDSVTLFDTEHIPAELVGEFTRARGDLRTACDRNAHERSRRFESCPLTATPEEAHRHVEGRSEDLAQARPELGHATNAVCVVGRRDRTRGLFFDRRAFLTSYDPTQDTPDAAVLARTLAAVFPVCGGINLEYLFSHTDPAGYGCGTKLPHNITALLGVVDGAAGDLRTGLPWQMTEIHEPVRLLIVVEATADTMLRLMAANPTVGDMTRNGWVQVALLHPATGQVSVYGRGEFVPYTPSGEPLRRVRASAEWYGGRREHLEFVEVASAEGGRA
jgi:uncharacterized protein YbcC (UPF0753/DUF2309 family)